MENTRSTTTILAKIKFSGTSLEVVQIFNNPVIIYTPIHLGLFIVVTNSVIIHTRYYYLHLL